MNENIEALGWLPELTAMVRERLSELGAQHREHGPNLQTEYQELEASIQGWSTSLANPKLPTSLRRTIEEQYGAAIDRMEEINSLLSEQVSQVDHAEELLDPQEILRRIDCLDDLLAGDNVTLGNLELSLHIDKIVCSPEGKVVLRTCKLGGLTGAVDMLKEPCLGNDVQSDGPDVLQSAKSRRRGRARLGEADDDREEMRALSEFACDTNRFAGLPKEWFWHDEFVIPETIHPFQAVAIDVATDRLAGLTHEQLSSKYGMTPPTIRKALKHAARIDEKFNKMPKKMARARWHEDHADEVVALKESQGLGTQQLVEHFGKSDVTIRKAIEYHRQQRLNDGVE
jgi:hypothetical protein